MRLLLEYITKVTMSKILIYLGLLAFLVVFYKATMLRGCNLGYIVAASPLISIGLFFLLKNPLWSYTFFFVNNYIIMGITRYISLPVPISVFMDSIMN